MALGRTKIGRRQRAATFEDQQGSFEDQQALEPDHELESYLAALSPEEDVETTGTGRRFGASQVYQLRLPLMANEQLKELAARQGTSPDALVRDWVMEQLARYEGPGAAPEPAPAEQQHAWPQDHAPTRQATPPPHPEQQYAGDLYGGNDPHNARGPHAGASYAGEPHPATRPAYRGAGYSHYDDQQTDAEITIPHAQRRY